MDDFVVAASMEMGEMPMEELENYFNKMDQDGNGMVDRREWKDAHRGGKEGHDGPDRNGKESKRTPQEYWDQFGPAAPETEMQYDQFMNGYRSTNPSASDEEIQGAYYMGDLNGSGSLNWREFENLFMIG